MNNEEEQKQPVDNSQPPVDKSANGVDNSQQSVDNSQQSVDNSQQSVDNSQEQDKSVDNSTDDFDAEAYLKSLEPEDNQQPDIQQLQNELKVATQQRDALKAAYLQLKKTGVTVVSNPQSNNQGFNSQDDTDKVADAMLQKYLNH